MLPRFVLAGVAACISALASVAQERPSEPTIPPGQQRGEKARGGGPMRYWPDRADRAEVLSASFVGGKGVEWLVDGGFQPDGGLVLAGNVIGGVFDLPVQVRALGEDGARPPEYRPTQRTDRAGKPVVDALGRPAWEPPTWRAPTTTGFLVRLDPALKRVTAACRLPWAAGSITACEVADDGSVYIAGRAAADAARMSRNSEEAAAAVEGVKNPACDRTFVARIAPDFSGVAWMRAVAGPSYALRLTLRRDGTVTASLQDLRTYDPNGRLLSAVPVAGGLGKRNSVSPVDGRIVRGGEHNWPTGREPWRCPTLNVLKPDGTLLYHLYDWGGPYVGLDGLRQVSDTAVRRVAHDRNGNVLCQLWSDGGNSVALQQPTDIRRGVGFRGVGLTAAGAGATSFAYLVRIEPENYQVTGWTLWCSQYGNKANGAGIDCIAQADDGSFCFAGGSAWGLLQTANKLANGEPAGPYVAVLTPDLSGVRYASCVPGAGMAELGDDRDSWGIATGMAAGKPRAVFCCGAGADGDVYGLVTPTPAANAAQGSFGGGIADGWFAVVDLSRPVPPSPPSEIGGTARLSHQRDARPQGGKPGRGETAPADGTVFAFRPDFPKWVTVDAEFRSTNSVAVWPHFFYGKPVSGELVWQDGAANGTFTVECANACQPRGDQSRRVLGALFGDGEAPKLIFTLHSIERPVAETFQRAEPRGGARAYELPVCAGKATLDIGGRQVAVRPKCVVRAGQVAEKSIQKVTVSAYFTLRGRDLGWTGKAAEQEIDARITAQGMQRTGQ